MIHKIDINVRFGAIIAATFIIAAVLIYNKDGDILTSPTFQNISSMLLITGIFLGIRERRDRVNGGYIKYKEALINSLKITLYSLVLYGLFIYIIYSKNMALQDEFINRVMTIFKETYSETFMGVRYDEMVISAGIITFTEIFGKIIYGVVFSLVISGILRKAPQN